MSAFEFSNPDGVRRAAPTYSHAAVLAPGAKRVLISGQVGMEPDGSVPETPAAQIEQTYRNLKTVLAAHGLGLSDIVRQRIFVTDRDVLAPYREVRARFMGDHAPVSTLLIVSGLTDPRLVVEIEVEAAGEPSGDGRA